MLLCPVWQKGCKTGEAQSLAVEVAHPGKWIMEGCCGTSNPRAAAGVGGGQAQLVLSADAPGIFPASDVVHKQRGLMPQQVFLSPGSRQVLIPLLQQDWSTWHCF